MLLQISIKLKVKNNVYIKITFQPYYFLPYYNKKAYLVAERQLSFFPSSGLKSKFNPQNTSVFLRLNFNLP